MKRWVYGTVLGAMLLGGSIGYAAKGGAKHPNLVAAHKEIKQALEKLTAAQKANEYDMEGHAAKAKELLEQAEGEIKQAAEAATENKDKK